VQILTYPVGVVVGMLPLVVELGVPPKPASLHLDGRAACALTAEAPGWFEEKKTPLIGPGRLLVPDRVSGVFGGSGSVVGVTGVVAAEALRESDLLQGGSPELWVERLVAALRSGKRGPIRTADAVAAAGFRNGAAPRRRAVILLLGDTVPDSSVLPLGGVRNYLDEVRVPFEAWNLGADERPEWQGARRIGAVEDLYDALIDLRLRVTCQAVVWLEADFLSASASASAAARGAGPALKRLPDTSAPVLPVVTPSDDVTRRTLERVRTKGR
jgi:hypothetical protein